MKGNIVYAQRLEHRKDLCVSRTGLESFLLSDGGEIHTYIQILITMISGIYFTYQN